jgi:small conductance mechanosensitive channel
MDVNAIWAQVQSEAIRYGIMVIGALVMWIIGRWAISMVDRMVRHALTKRHVDATLQQYLVSIINVALNILLVIAILGQFGVQTT